MSYACEEAKLLRAKTNNLKKISKLNNSKCVLLHITCVDWKGFDVMSKCLEVKKVRPVKTMWLSLIPTSYSKAAERATSANRRA